MRHEASAIALSWIPSEAVEGMSRAIFDSGIGHYDPPPPDSIEDLEELRQGDRFRFANHLAAFARFEDGVAVEAGYLGGCSMGATTVGIGPLKGTFAAVAFPDIQRPIILGESSVTFVQTVGGHTALPAPRRLSRPPFVAWEAPTVWTTLELVINADGTSSYTLVGASSFPRHWVYDQNSKLAAKAGLADYKDWWLNSFGKHTPWGDVDSAPLVTAVETALERDVAAKVMRGGEKPSYRTLEVGETLTTQGEVGDEIFLLLNGVLSVIVDGAAVAEVGPGAILGERAALEGGVRTSTLTAVTSAKVAVAHHSQLDPDALYEISHGHRREDLSATTAASSGATSGAASSATEAPAP